MRELRKAAEGMGGTCHRKWVVIEKAIKLAFRMTTKLWVRGRDK